MSSLTADVLAPFRPLDWRWRLVVGQASPGQRPFRRIADRRVREAIQFWRLLHACRTEEQRHRLAVSMPAVHAAYVLHAQGASFGRFALECRVLAGEPIEAIAKKNAISPAVIQVYEYLFFDIRPYLDSPDYVLQTIQDGAEGLDQGRKYIAYRGGPFVADVLLAHAGPANKPTDAKQVAGFFTRDERETMALNRALAARLLSPTESRLAAEAIKQNSGSNVKDTGSDDCLAGILHEVLQEIGKTFEVGYENLPPLVAKYVVGRTVQPRADDLMLLRQGIEPPHLAALLDAKFPMGDAAPGSL